jgi:hypothetical protein
METKIPQTYIPGVCNIGEAEIDARKRIGWIGLAVTIVVWILLDLLKVAPWLKLIIFLPAAMSATGFIQGFSHFCAGFGMRGVFNFGDTLNKTDTVEQAEFRAQDKKKARAIFLYSILAGIIVAAVAYLV